MVEKPIKSEFSNDELESLINGGKSGNKSPIKEQTSPIKEPLHKKPGNMRPRSARPRKPPVERRVERRVERPPRPVPAPEESLSFTLNQLSAIVYAEHITDIAESLSAGLKKSRLYEARAFLLNLVGIDEAVIYMPVPQYDRSHEGEIGAYENSDSGGGENADFIENSGKYAENTTDGEVGFDEDEGGWPDDELVGDEDEEEDVEWGSE